MPWERRKNLVDCTIPSSPCSLSLVPFMLLPICYILDRGLQGILPNCCSLHSSTWLRFVPFILLLAHRDLGTLLSYRATNQVIGPLLIIQRVVNRTALTSDAISGNVGSIRFKSQEESTTGDVTLPERDLMSSVDEAGDTTGEFGVSEAESVHTIEEVTRVR